MTRARLALLIAPLACATAALALPVAIADGPSRVRRHAGVTEGIDCGACHTPHGWKTLSDGAGVGFDHSRTGFPLTGRHARTPCTGCHHRGALVTRECTGCHQDAHQLRLGTDCAECHSSVSWQRVDAFERHRLTLLPLTGMHALADCSECHQRTTDSTYGPVPADCFACHADAYRRTDIHPLHVGGIGDPPAPPLSRNCAECHRPSGWVPAVIARSAFDRAATADALLRLQQPPERHEFVFPVRHGAHRSAECSDCHLDERTPRAVRCTGCHAHNPVRLRAQHPSEPLAAKDGSCLGCHRGGMPR